MVLEPVTPDSQGFDQLRTASEAEGHRMLMRFVENWRAGTNRFRRPGEIMLGLRRDGALLGVCGRNIDPYDTHPRAGRVRQLYVDPSARGQGVGRELIDAIRTDAAVSFDYLNTNAPETAFAFYERLGFRRLQDVAHMTHRLTL
jgi:GNAT superfamily N-acetyltransferase